MKFSNSKNRVKEVFIYTYKHINAHLILLLIFNLGAIGIYAQPKKDSNSISIKCELPKVVRTNKELNAKIIIRNKSSKTQYFYDELVAGNFTSDIVIGQLKSFVDINFKVEKKTNGHFKSYTGSFVEPAPSSDSFDIPTKSRIYPGDSVIKYFHIDSRYTFIPGEYRLRCFYWNDIHSNHYVVSSWIYFHVLNIIYAKHDYD